MDNLFKRILIVLVVFIAPFFNCAVSAQLEFEKVIENQITQFNYQWSDAQKQTQSFSFSISNRKLNNRFRNFKAYKPRSAMRQMNMALQKAMANVDIRKVQTKFVQRSQDLEIKLKSNDAELLKETQVMLNNVKNEALSAYLKKNYYNRFESALGENGIKPDHKRFINESKGDLDPIVKALVNKFQKRVTTKKLTEFVLGFVQSIPYSTLESRLETSGAGFSPPLKLLNNNLGDCDSKSVLMASIMKSIFPRVSIAIIYIPNHALLGMQLPITRDDDYVEIDGLKYLLMEPTGPAKLPYAKASKSSKIYVDGGQFSYELI